jgi:hypothetical protein
MADQRKPDEQTGEGSEEIPAPSSTDESEDLVSEGGPTQDEGP